jgi:hypothetical protein
LIKTFQQRGKPLFPRSLKVWISNLKEAMVAGGISAIGSSPFIVLTVLTGGWAYLPAKAAANFVGIFFVLTIESSKLWLSKIRKF